MNAAWGEFPSISRRVKRDPVTLKWLLDHGADRMRRNRNRTALITLRGISSPNLAFASNTSRRGGVTKTTCRAARHPARPFPQLAEHSRRLLAVNRRFPELEWGQNGPAVSANGSNMLHVAAAVGMWRRPDSFRSRCEVNARAPIEEHESGERRPIFTRNAMQRLGLRWRGVIDAERICDCVKLPNYERSMRWRVHTLGTRDDSRA